MEDREMPDGRMGRESAGDSMPTPDMGESMPSARMSNETSDAGGGMRGGGMQQSSDAPQGALDNGHQRVLVEIRVPPVAPGARSAGARDQAAGLAAGLPGLTLDPEYEPVPMKGRSSGDAPGEAAGTARSSAPAAEETVIVRATVDPRRIAELEADPSVVKVYPDSRIAPFEGTADFDPRAPRASDSNGDTDVLTEQRAGMSPGRLVDGVGEYRPDAPTVVERPEAPALGLIEGMATCPIGTCDCTPGTAKGTMADVANYLGVSQIWAAGKRGEGMVVGVVDGGIRAAGRPIKPGETGATLGRVIGGWPTATWGTTAAAWSDHGMMCGTDVLGMAPSAQLFDLRISDGSALSDALQAFQWAIDRHRADGTPHVLSNSWGMFQKAWDPDYTTNANHPFTRKVVEAIDEGILVLFAAGNCGGTCPDGRCGTDTGPGKSIWGANGHPRVMTVGAVNRLEQLAGYSSQGPASLDANKPDFCSITHFRGYFASDSGTSAATPIAAGVVALLKQAKPSVTQDQLRAALRSTAKDIGPAGWDQHSGTGIIRAKAAYDVVAVPSLWRGWGSLGGFCTDGVGVSSWAPGRLDCFVVGNDRQLHHKWFDGGWSGWEPLGGNIYSNPAAVSWGPNRIDVFAIGGDHAMWHRWWDGAAWRGWESLGGFATDGVGVSSWAPGRLDCFVVGNDRRLYHKWYAGGWSGWEDLGGNIYSDPAAVSWGPNRIDVFAIGGDHAMWHRWWDGTAWRGWESLGGFCTDGVGVSSWAPGRLDCFVVGNDRHLYHKWYAGGWSGWEDLGGNIYSNPAAVSWGSNRIDVFAIGGDHAMWQRWYE